MFEIIRTRHIPGTDRIVQTQDGKVIFRGHPPSWPLNKPLPDHRKGD